MDNANNPFAGLPENLIPNPPAGIPEAPGAGNLLRESRSPFAEPLDVDAIINNLVLDRPLKLYIPNLHKYVGFEFHIINNLPQEIADAQNKGFRKVDDPELAQLFVDLVAGTDKVGKAYGLMLYARPKAVGNVVRKRQRQQLASIYAGMDPNNKELTASAKYAEVVRDGQNTKMTVEGRGFRIRV